MNRKLWSRLTGAVLWLCLGSAWAFDPFVVQSIEIQGLARHDVSRVNRAINLNVGERVDDERVRQMTRELDAILGG